MKILRAALVAIFVFATLFTTTARASGQTAGFIPLLSAVDPNIPVETQTQNALNFLMPKLLSLQEQGVISEFEPELKLGFLKLMYENGADLSSLLGRKVYSDIQDVKINIPDSAITHAVIAKQIRAGFSPTFEVYVYSNCFFAFGVGASSHVLGSIRDTTGRVVSMYDGVADSSGNIQYGCFSYSGSLSEVIPGYKVTFTTYDNAAHLLGTKLALVPPLNFTKIDKVTSIAAGTAPKSKPYDLIWFHLNLNPLNNFIKKTSSAVVSTAGTWSRDFGTVKFRGGDTLNLWVHPTNFIQFNITRVVPNITCQLGGDFCSLNGTPFKAAAFTVIHGGVAYKFSGKFDRLGVFSIHLENAAGTPIFLKTGDKVSGTGVATYILPRLTAAVNFTTNIMSGNAPANKYFSVSAYVPASGLPAFTGWAHSNSAGAYAFNFTSKINLLAGQPADYMVNYIDPVTGNVTNFTYSVGP